jgi:argininosuccinate lyase
VTVVTPPTEPRKPKSLVKAPSSDTPPVAKSADQTGVSAAGKSVGKRGSKQAGESAGIAAGGALWHGRFATAPAHELVAFTDSLSFDKLLFSDDIAGSRAHVRGLGRVGLLSEEDVDAVLEALDQVHTEMSAGSFVFVPSDEDIHTAVERRVTQLAGAAGARLHTGRSRNDQSATDLRLFTKRELSKLALRVHELRETLLVRAIEAGQTYLPGYTHLQRAQPVLLAHHLLAHTWALGRDQHRIFDCVRRMDVSPLGAGALAGSSLPLDPDWVAHELGFARRFENSLDAVSDRDYVAESLFVISLLGVHLSRMGEEVVLWATEEFGFAKLPDAYSTGSSMMPQKKNPDIAELARGKSGRLIGNLTGFLATLKSLPLSYNRDLQEDKEPLFDSLTQIMRGLSAMNGMYSHLQFDAQRMQSAADQPFVAATDLAEYLVTKGMPFRDAHAIVGELVRSALDRRLDFAELVENHPSLGPSAAALLEPGVAVSRRTTPGGGGPAPVAEQIERCKAQLDADRKRVTAL